MHSDEESEDKKVPVFIGARYERGDFIDLTLEQDGEPIDSSS